MMAPHRPALGFKLILGTLLLAALIVPLLGEPYYTKLIARMAILAIAAMTLDLLVGYAGLVSFGHAAFFGLGVYTAGLLPMLWNPAGDHHFSRRCPDRRIVRVDLGGGFIARQRALLHLHHPGLFPNGVLRWAGIADVRW